MTRRKLEDMFTEGPTQLLRDRLGSISEFSGTWRGKKNRIVPWEDKQLLRFLSPKGHSLTVFHRVVKERHGKQYLTKKKAHKASLLETKRMTPKQVSQVVFLWDSSLPHQTREQQNQIWNSDNITFCLLSTPFHLPISYSSISISI